MEQCLLPKCEGTWQAKTLLCTALASLSSCLHSSWPELCSKTPARVPCLALPGGRRAPAAELCKSGTGRGQASALLLLADGSFLCGLQEDQSGNTYEDFKRAAKQTGDAAKVCCHGVGLG